MPPSAREKDPLTHAEKIENPASKLCSTRVYAPPLHNVVPEVHRRAAGALQATVHGDRVERFRPQAALVRVLATEQGEAPPQRGGRDRCLGADGLRQGGADVVGEVRGCQVDGKMERRYPDAAAVVDASV